MKKVFSKEVIIGLISVVSLLILYVGLNYLKGINLFKPSNHYYVLMPNVTDLQNSSPIYVDGFKVGVVSAIRYDFSSPKTDHILVEMSLDKKMRLQTGSYVELKSSLTAGAYLDLVLNKYVSSYCHIGDTLAGIKNPGLMDKLADEMLPQVENILPRLDSILMGIQHIVTHPALNQSLTHIDALTADLRKSSAQLNSLLSNDVPVIMADLKAVSSNFNEVSENIRQIDFDKTVSTVETTVQSINSAVESLEEITRQANSSDNSLGLLLNDTSLYNYLDSTARNAAELLKDLKENPKKYVHFSVF
jgi:ABC-type transport system involved in resistance to organic solvents, periplasmic component